MAEKTREHRPDETTAEKYTRETTEAHVEGVERASSKGLLTRKQAIRVTEAGQKGTRSHDMARGIRGCP